LTIQPAFEAVNDPFVTGQIDGEDDAAAWYQTAGFACCARAAAEFGYSVQHALAVNQTPNGPFSIGPAFEAVYDAFVSAFINFINRSATVAVIIAGANPIVAASLICHSVEFVANGEQIAQWIRAVFARDTFKIVNSLRPGKNRSAIAARRVTARGGRSKRDAVNEAESAQRVGAARTSRKAVNELVALMTPSR
jgi:hypothetical protein